MQSTYDKGCDELKDESGAIDICAHCAAEGKLQPGLYFCFQCGPFGRYICGDCNKQHNKFLNGHKIRDVSTAANQPRGSSNMQEDEIQQAKQQLECLVKEIETQKEVLDKVIPDGELARNIYEVRKKLSKDNSKLSRLIGNRLTDNNPDIVDLSDENRPTKLAEKYQELYDEQRTDAFEELDKIYHNEKKSIRYLKQVFEDIKEHCDKMAKIQNDTLFETVTIKKTGIHVSNEILKQLKDLSKATAGVSIPGVYERYIEEVKQNHKETVVHMLLNAKVLPFIKRSIELCWLMSVQDPPLAFGTDPKATEPFDTDVFKFYTRTGTYCEYVVWPPLYLFKDGPLLNKGIAQGFTPQEFIKPTTSQRGHAPAGTSFNTGTEGHGYTRHSDDKKSRDSSDVNINETKHHAEQKYNSGYNLTDFQMHHRYYTGPDMARLSRIGEKPEVHARAGTSFNTGTEGNLNKGYTRHSDDRNSRDASGVNINETKHRAEQKYNSGYNVTDSQTQHRYYTGPDNARLSRIGEKPEVKY